MPKRQEEDKKAKLLKRVKQEIVESAEQNKNNDFKYPKQKFQFKQDEFQSYESQGAKDKPSLCSSI